MIIKCVDSGNCEIKNQEDLFDLPPQFLNLPPAVVELQPARIFDRFERKKILKNYFGKTVTMRLSKVRNQEIANFFYESAEINIGVDLKFKTHCLDLSHQRDYKGVVLSYVESIGLIWVQLNENAKKLDFVMDKIASMKSLKCLKPAQNPPPKQGDFVVAQYKGDEELYRAQVVDVVKNQATIHFIDFGNQQKTDVDQLFELPEAVSIPLYPPMAFFVELKRMESYEDTAHNRQLLEELLTNDQFIVYQDDEESHVEFISDNSGEWIQFGGYNRSHATEGNLMSCKSSISSNIPEQTSYIECLREEENVLDVSLHSDLECEVKRRPADLSLPTIEEQKEENVEDVLVVSPRLRAFSFSKRKKTDCERSKSDWSIGDTVIAFWTSDGCWREGVIHELDSSAALVVCNDNDVRPAFIDLSLIKPANMPLDALNKFESDVENLLGVSSIKPKVVKKTPLNRSKDSLQDVSKTTAVMTPSMIFSADPEDFCKFARSGNGSRFLQSLVSPSNTKLCHNMLSLLLSSGDTTRMMTNAKSSFLFQKLLMHLYIFPIDQQEQFLDVIEQNFSWLSTNEFGYHIANTAITHLGLEHGRRFASKMENKTLLLGLTKSQYGTFVAQSCVPLFETTTINFVVNSLLGHMVGLSNNKSGSYFIQSFLTHWAHHPSLDLLVEDITKHLRCIVHHNFGVHTVQTLVKARSNDYATIMKIVDWFVLNIEPVYKDPSDISSRALITTIKTIKERFLETGNSKWKELVDKLLFKILVGSNSDGRSHLVAASCHRSGHKIVASLAAASKAGCVSDSVRTNLVQTLLSYRTVLNADSIGCQILKMI